MSRILIGLAALLVANCAHAPRATQTKPHAPIDRYTLPWQAQPGDLFCAQQSPFDETTSEDDRAPLACVPVQELRQYLRTKRFAP